MNRRAAPRRLMGGNRLASKQADVPDLEPGHDWRARFHAHFQWHKNFQVGAFAAVYRWPGAAKQDPETSFV
jgi:hypothetical protein